MAPIPHRDGKCKSYPNSREDGEVGDVRSVFRTSADGRVSRVIVDRNSVAFFHGAQLHLGTSRKSPQSDRVFIRCSRHSAPATAFGNLDIVSREDGSNTEYFKPPLLQERHCFESNP